MKNYELLKLTSQFKNVIVATSYLNPLEDIEEIECFMKCEDVTGDVLFDLTLCNGLNSNRYIKIQFDDGRLNMETLEILKNVDINVKREISLFYINNYSCVESSILPKPQMFLLKKGQLI